MIHPCLNDVIDFPNIRLKHSWLLLGMYGFYSPADKVN